MPAQNGYAHVSRIAPVAESTRRIEETGLESDALAVERHDREQDAIPLGIVGHEARAHPAGGVRPGEDWMPIDRDRGGRVRRSDVARLPARRGTGGGHYEGERDEQRPEDEKPGTRLHGMQYVVPYLNPIRAESFASFEIR